MVTDFEQVFVDNREYIFKYLARLSRNVSLAEELTQETFFRAYMNYASLRNKEKVTAWLCQIAKNTYFAWYNEHKQTTDWDGVELPDDSADPEEELVQQELSREVLGRLHELEEPYKEVFMLSALGGVPLKEISAIFGKSESWARVTCYRAKQKLLERMRK